jgi:hypothetical protein
MRVIPSRHTDPITSHKGAKDVKLRADGQKMRLLKVYDQFGQMNSEQAAKLAGISMRSCFWKRCSELCLDMSYLLDTGKEEPGDSGSMRIVYEITSDGSAYLSNHR